MRHLGAAAFVLVALMLTLSLGAGSASAAAPKVNFYTLAFDGAQGYSDDYQFYQYHYKGNPGPTLRALDNESFDITFYAQDQYRHAFFIDSNNDTYAGQDEPMQPEYYYQSRPGHLAFSMTPGTYVYRDVTNTSWYGLMVVGQHTEPWFKWDPFFIFGLMMAIAIVGWVVYVSVYAVKGAHARRQIKSTNPEIIKWVKGVMDPDGPTRPTQKYIDNIRVEKKKLRKAHVAEMKQRREPPQPPGGNDNLGSG